MCRSMLSDHISPGHPERRATTCPLPSPPVEDNTSRRKKSRQAPAHHASMGEFSKLLPLSLVSSVLLQMAASAPRIPPPSGTGPVLNVNFPDPTIIFAGNTWYAFATNDQADHINVQVASSTDFSNWTLHQGQDALPTIPSWAVGPWKTQVWAPDVNETVSISTCFLSEFSRTAL